MKHISYNCRCIFDGRKYYSSQNCKPTKISTKYEKTKNLKIKKQTNIVYVEKVTRGIPLHIFASVIKVMKLRNISKIALIKCIINDIEIMR